MVTKGSIHRKSCEESLMTVSLEVNKWNVIERCAGIFIINLVVFQSDICTKMGENQCSSLIARRIRVFQ